MERAEALAELQRMHSIKATLAAAPRKGKLAVSVGELHKREAAALAVAITALGG